jgi:hypothetical protein
MSGPYPSRCHNDIRNVVLEDRKCDGPVLIGHGAARKEWAGRFAFEEMSRHQRSRLQKAPIE